MSRLFALAEYTDWVRTSGSGEFWLATTVGVLLAAAAGFGAFVFLRRKRVIEDMPTARVRSAPQGYIELQGRAELMDGDPIHAPLSMRVCAWYAYKVEHREKRHSRGERASRWTTIDKGTSEHLFYLVDPTGRCAIDPDGAAVTPTHRNVWYGQSRIAGRYHPSDGVWWARALGSLGRPYRYSESRIEPDDDIYAIGNFTTHGGAASAFDKDGAVGDRLRDWKRDQAFMLRQFDANRDGQIDLAEWETARMQAERDVLTEQQHAPGPPPVDLLARTDDRQRPFIIAAGTEQALIAHYRNVAGGLLAVAIPVLCLALWAVALRLT